MKKKVLATLLVGAMAASLLAGCGTTVETTGSSDTTTAPEKTQTTETADRKSTRLNSSHPPESRMPSSA